MAAISQLGGLQASLKEGLGADISPLKANQLKNLVGSRVRWNGTNAIGDEVKPAYKAVYASLSEVNDAVPEIADLNERLTNLYAAQDDLIRLARNEEVSRGAGAMRGTIGTSLVGKRSRGGKADSRRKFRSKCSGDGREAESADARITSQSRFTNRSIKGENRMASKAIRNTTGKPVTVRKPRQAPPCSSRRKSQANRRSAAT